MHVQVVCCMACCNVAGRMLHQVRQLEAVVRIAESLAKMSLAPVATEEHVNEVRCSMLFRLAGSATADLQQRVLQAARRR